MIDVIIRDVNERTLLVHSSDVSAHRKHLEEVFRCLRDAQLMLRGGKCHIGLLKVSYLGHVFSANGVVPDRKKVQAVQDWPIPEDAITLR